MLIDDGTLYDSSSVIRSTYVHFIIFGMSIFAIGWGIFCAHQVSSAIVFVFLRLPALVFGKLRTRQNNRFSRF